MTVVVTFDYIESPRKSLKIPVPTLYPRQIMYASVRVRLKYQFLLTVESYIQPKLKTTDIRGKARDVVSEDGKEQLN